MHGVKDLHEIVCDRAVFSGKKNFAAEIEKIDQNQAKNRVYWKIWSLIFTEFVL